jgi:DNA-binding response OmpR family regulator
MTKKLILVIEDDSDVRLGFHILLKANGYRTCFAPDCLSAISEARKQDPDLILLDLGLPAGDGFVVLQRLRAIPSLAIVPVIVVSARDHSANQPRALAAGAKAYLQKPWDDRELLAIIAKELGELEPIPRD